MSDKITTAGVYDIEIGKYHHDPNLCDGPSISASGLKQVADCPAKYFAHSPINPNRFPPKDTNAFAVGRAAHALVLGEPEFDRYFVISPHDDFRTTSSKEWRAAQTRTVLKSADFDLVVAMAKAQRESPAVMQAFEHGEPEKSLIWKDKETGVWLKARPDWLPHDPSVSFVADYKTAVTIEPRRLSVDVFRYSYHVQAALQVDAVREVMGVMPLGIAHIVQEKDPPYLADLRMFSPEALDFGRLICRKALRTFADCLHRGKWPGYTNEPQYFETPSWIARQMEEFNDVDGSSESVAHGFGPDDYYAAG